MHTDIIAVIFNVLKQKEGWLVALIWFRKIVIKANV